MGCERVREAAVNERNGWDGWEGKGIFTRNPDVNPES
jgi:hypothetical protein